MATKATDNNDPERKRFIIMAGAMVAVLALVSAAFLYFSRPAPKTAGPKENSFSLSEADKTATESLVNNFITAAGNWGVRPEALSKENIYDVYQLLNGVESTVPETYWDDRQVVYRMVQANYLANEGPLVYNMNTVSRWNDQLSKKSLATFRANNITTTVYERGGLLTYREKEVPSVNVSVTFDTKETVRQKSADDSAWDGTYDVMTKTFNNSMTMTLVKLPEGWRVYSYKDLNHPFVLATWNSSDFEYQNDQFDFVKVDSIKGRLPK